MKTNIRLVDGAEDRGRVHRWGLFSEPAGRALRAWAEGRTPDLAKVRGELAHDVQYPSRR